MRYMTQYDASTKTMEIYLSGCNNRCLGCHNPELQDFEYGIKMNLQKLYNKLSQQRFVINRIWILGGEVLHQDPIQLDLFFKMINLTKKEIWLFTSFEFENISDEIKQYFDYIKTGPYIQGRHSIEQMNIKLASDNQFIHKIDRERP